MSNDKDQDTDKQKDYRKKLWILSYKESRKEGCDESSSEDTANAAVDAFDKKFGHTIRRTR